MGARVCGIKVASINIHTAATRLEMTEPGICTPKRGLRIQQYLYTSPLQENAPTMPPGLSKPSIVQSR
jgi:hypothetical protein